MNRYMMQHKLFIGVQKNLDISGIPDVNAIFFKGADTFWGKIGPKIKHIHI